MNYKIKLNLLAFWSLMLSILLLGLISWATCFLNDPKDKIAVFAIVGIIITAITSVITVNTSNQKAKEREYELMLMKEKQKVFDYFYEYIFKIFNDVKKNKNTPTVRVEEYIKFKRGLMNWGSERIIKDFIVYDNMIQDTDIEIKDRIIALENFLKSIRIELNNKVSKNVSLLGILINEEARKEFGL
jgi:hypothetical protein